MRAKISCVAAVLFAALQMGCGKQASPPLRADTTTAPPPQATMKAEPLPPGMHIPTRKEYDSIQAAWRKQGRRTASPRMTNTDSTRR
jgi:hypothetical protein